MRFLRCAVLISFIFSFIEKVENDLLHFMNEMQIYTNNKVSVLWFCNEHNVPHT